MLYETLFAGVLALTIAVRCATAISEDDIGKALDENYNEQSGEKSRIRFKLSSGFQKVQPAQFRNKFIFDVVLDQKCRNEERLCCVFGTCIRCARPILSRPQHLNVHGSLKFFRFPRKILFWAVCTHVKESAT